MAPPFATGPRLASGALLPAIGLGVYRAAPGEETQASVASALQCGYRHIDTAAAYHNEADVGRAIKASGIPRSEIFVTTKMYGADSWGYDRGIAAIQRSLSHLGLDYLDLMLLHAPGDPSTRAETWAALEYCREQGLVRDIGVSNFGIPHLEKLLMTARIVPAVNQIELHPWLQRRELVAYCQGKGIVLEAYSPLAKARKLSDPVVADVASRVGASPAEVLIAWSLSKGFVAIPKTVVPARQMANLHAADVSLREADVAALDALEEGLVTGWDPVATAEV